MKDHDSGIIDIRNKIMRAFNRSNPTPTLAQMLDAILAEYTDSIIDRQETRRKAKVEENESATDK